MVSHTMEIWGLFVLIISRLNSTEIPAGHDDYEDLPEGLLSRGVPELVLEHVTCVKGCPGDLFYYLF